MNSFSRSWAVAKQSMAVLRSQPQLMGFPVVSAIASLLITASFFVPAYFAYGGQRTPDHMPPLAYVVMAAYYLCSYFVVIFFNVGMVACTHAALRGERMSFGEGISQAGRHLGPILGWTLLSATVGMVLQIVAERLGFIGRIVVGLIGGAWNIVTYFVVPVIAIADKGPIDAVKDSAALLKRTWGPQVIGSGGIGLAFGLLSLLALPVFVLAAMTGSVTFMVVTGVSCVVYWIVLATVGSSLSGIYRTALYVYANSGETPQGFTQDAVALAFKSKKG